jgi:hypothetical protein
MCKQSICNWIPSSEGMTLRCAKAPFEGAK